MKKAIFLLLALVLCLSLCACGGSNDAPKSNESKETPAETEPAKPEIVELVLGETYTSSMFDMTITGFDFSAEITDPDGSTNIIVPMKDHTAANIYFDIKYTGKSTIDTSYLTPLHLDYNDGYSFPLDRFYYYNTEFDTWLNSGKIEPLCPEFSCKACFRVPLEVKENEEAPLFIQFMIDNKDVIYKVR